MKFRALLIFLMWLPLGAQMPSGPREIFEKADRTAEKYQGASLDTLPKLVHALTHSLPDEVARFRAIFTWVAHNITNDYHAYQRTKKNRKRFLKTPEAFEDWNQREVPKMVERLRSEKKTACTGYAYLIREMCELAGLPAKIINGYGRTAQTAALISNGPNHSWNAVKIKGTWYLADATWAAGKVLMTEDGPVFKKDYFDGYFMADPRAFIKNHYPLEKHWTLMAHPPTLKAFLEGPIVYKGMYGAGLIPQQPAQMNLRVQQGDTLAFTLHRSQRPLSLVALTLRLDRNGKIEEHSPNPKIEADHIVLSHVFDRKGRYDVHLMAQDMILATYVVRVKKVTASP